MEKRVFPPPPPPKKKQKNYNLLSNKLILCYMCIQDTSILSLSMHEKSVLFQIGWIIVYNSNSYCRESSRSILLHICSVNLLLFCFSFTKNLFLS